MVGIGRIAAIAAGVGLAGCAASGCASGPAGYAAWRQALERYVVEEGEGDPAVLRHLPGLRDPQTLRPARVTFGVLDVPASRRLLAPRCDVQGVLLGIPEVEGRHWYCFVVAQQHCRAWTPPELADVRLVAFALDDGVWTWRTSARAEAAVEVYRGVGAGDAGAWHVGFPGPADVFALEAAGGVATVRHEGTGATWRLELASDGQARSSPPDGAGL